MTRYSLHINFFFFISLTDNFRSVCFLCRKHSEGTCTIYINDTPKQTFVVEENMDLVIDGEPNAINRITFQCNYSEQADAPDVRQELCFVLLKFESIP